MSGYNFCTCLSVYNMGSKNTCSLMSQRMTEKSNLHAMLRAVTDLEILRTLMALCTINIKRPRFKISTVTRYFKDAWKCCHKRNEKKNRTLWLSAAVQAWPYLCRMTIINLLVRNSNRKKQAQGVQRRELWDKDVGGSTGLFTPLSTG